MAGVIILAIFAAFFWGMWKKHFSTPDAVADVKLQSGLERIYGVNDCEWKGVVLECKVSNLTDLPINVPLRAKMTTPDGAPIANVLAVSALGPNEIRFAELGIDKGHGPVEVRL